MKIINLIKCEFIKNYTLKNIIITFVLLLLSVFLLSYFTEFSYKSEENDYSVEIENKKIELEYYNNKERLTYKDKFMINRAKNVIDTLNKYKNVSGDSWQYKVINSNLRLDDEIILLKQIKENITDEYFFNIYNSNNVYYEYYEGLVRENYSSDKDVIDNKILEKEKKKDEYNKLLLKNKYYKYLEYVLENIDLPEDKIELYKIIIDKKIENEYDYRALNLIQLDILVYQGEIQVMDKDEFYTNTNIRNIFKSYERFVDYNEKMVNEYERKESIIEYSIRNDMKHDLEFDDTRDGISNGKKYITSKVIVNQGLNLSLVVIVIVILTSSGIVSKEHSSGTDKLLLTTHKRWKVLLSKFIYLILHSYIVWAIGLILLMIYAGIKYGFTDLFLPKLIFENNNVVEVNYLLYLLKDIFICSIPVITVLSIIMFLSTVTLSTSLTVGITLIFAILSPITWFLIYNFDFTFLVYTPLPYFDLGLIINNFEYYIKSLRLIESNVSMGLIISIVTTLILYLVTNYIYIKRDIKN